MNSSLTYEILLYLNAYYFSAFVLSELGMIIFKIINFPYPIGTLISEFLILIFLICTEALRIFMGHKGNLTEKSFSVITSMGLTAPSVLGIIYLIVWQTYVLRLEVILGAIQLTLQGLELGFALLCLMRFCRAGVYN